MQSLTVLTTLFTLAYAVTRTTPPEGAIVVSTKSCHGQFTTIQAAIDSLSTTSKSEQSVFIDRGVYKEQVFIPQRSAKLTVYGYTTDTTNYEANEVSITFNISSPEAGGNDQSGTVRVLSSDTHLYNLNIANTFGKGAQAVALSAQNDKQGYYGVRLAGYQDTLLSNNGDQFYSRSLITGRTDFIFGARARSWFEDCDIGAVTADGNGYVTALGRDSETNPAFYLFNNCRVAAAPGEQAPVGRYYLGRPWRSFARVVFQNTEMSDVVNPVGWTVWRAGDSPDDLEFGEYNNSGPGSVGPRASFTQKLTAPVEIGTVLDNYASWVDPAFLQGTA